MQGLSSKHERVRVKKCGMCTASDTSSSCFPSKANLKSISFLLACKSLKTLAITCCYTHALKVDTNVGRIAVRLGWVPLQPLPEKLQIHLLEL